MRPEQTETYFNWVSLPWKLKETNVKNDLDQHNFHWTFIFLIVVVELHIVEFIF